MSSRALRRAQRELEEKKQLEQLAQEKEEEEQDEEEEEDRPVPVAKSKASLFAMLGDGNDNDDEDEDVDEDAEPEPAASEPELKEEPVSTSKPSKKSKKKKKKAKGKAKEADSADTAAQSKAQADLDEIDQALLALKVTSDSKSGNGLEELAPAISDEKKHLFSALSVDKDHLHAANEMKKLFGRAALHGADDDEARARQRRGPQGGIAAAMGGRNAPGNRNLATLGLRRNIFIQGKEEWPRATSGGLGMEVVEKRSDGTVEYRFVHASNYRSVQQQFETCVASMDPERMVQLLHFNPYHVSTLLQVSEIAKQQRDVATAGELLERALFALGRAVHSTFAHNLAQGKARLDFRRPENREFWLAVWRYIGTLGIRATWRTAFEWAKLMISMSPEDDPYCIRLSIDQLALRGREPQGLIDMVESDYLQRAWKIPPNLAFSVALAHDRLKQPQEARKALRLAIKEYPWVAARLCKELDISPIPKSVWGKEPNGDHQELLCQLYAPHAKDLWNTTEGTTLLVEVCYSFEEALGAGEKPYWLAPINELDLTRRIMLSDDLALMNLLDPRIKSKLTSVSDPLPPDDNVKSYSTAAPPQEHISRANQAQLHAELERLRRYFQAIDLGALELQNDVTEEQLLPALERAGTTLEEFQQNEQRLQQIRPRLEELGFPGWGQQAVLVDSDAESDA